MTFAPGCPPQEVRSVAIVGAGVIGGGWAAHFLRMGLDVTAWDPAPGAQERLTRLITGAWPALARLGLRDGASPARLRFAVSLADAVAQAGFVQESAPEILPVKVKLLAELDAVTAPDVVIGSSTSGFLMTDLAAGTDNPGRFVVGHPFNPPYLIPLVEVVGGRDTDPAAVAWAEAFYTAAGKVCLTMTREVPGFVGNRLQEALWREALHMIDSGEATVRQIDDAITYGPGLRWAQMGPMLTFHLAGGQGGMARMLDHFGPALLEPWTRLTAPELTPQLRDLVVAGIGEVVGPMPVDELERRRDAFLADLLLLLDKHHATGTARPERVWPAALYARYRTTVGPDLIDYNGHLNDAGYAVLLSAANEVLLDDLGLSETYRRATGRALYTVGSHIRYLAECKQGDALAARSLLVTADAKRVRLHTELVRSDDTIAATGEYLYLHVDEGAGGVTAMPADRWAAVAALLAAQSGLPRPDHLGRGIGS